MSTDIEVTVDGAGRQLPDERVVRARGAGHDEEPGRALVEAVHDPRAFGLAQGTCSVRMPHCGQLTMTPAGSVW